MFVFPQVFLDQAQSYFPEQGVKQMDALSHL